MKACPLSIISGNTIECLEFKCSLWRLAGNGEEYCSFCLGIDAMSFRSLSWWRRLMMFIASKRSNDE